MILVFGKSGQLARALAAQSDDVHCVGRDQVNLCDTAALTDFLETCKASALINAAAYTAVDMAESDEETAHALNATAPGVMARYAVKRGIPLVHVSTDYVFDGSGDTAWHPDSPTAPLNAYGRSKLAGEEAVRAASGVHAILRTSWVISAHGQNFVTTMLRLGAERDRLGIVADQIGAPTPADDLAAACLTIARTLRGDPALSGTYHFTGTPYVSWADVAREIFRQADLDCTVDDIPTSAYPTAATRPLNARLDMTATTAAFDIAPPDWRDGLARILNEYVSDLAEKRPNEQDMRQ